MDLNIRSAVAADVPLILSLVRELAAYEKLAHEVVATEADFSRSLFGAPPRAHALVLEAEGTVAGFALYFYNFSTFLGRPGLYIEDVFVRPGFRRQGLLPLLRPALRAGGLQASGADRHRGELRADGVVGAGLE